MQLSEMVRIIGLNPDFPGKAIDAEYGKTFSPHWICQKYSSDHSGLFRIVFLAISFNVANSKQGSKQGDVVFVWFQANKNNVPLFPHGILKLEQAFRFRELTAKPLAGQMPILWDLCFE